MAVASLKKEEREIAYKQISISAPHKNLKVSKTTVVVHPGDHIMFTSRLTATVRFENVCPFEDDILEFSITAGERVDKTVKSFSVFEHTKACCHRHRLRHIFKYSVVAEGYKILDPQIIVECDGN